MALYLIPRRPSKRSSPTLNDESRSTIGRILTLLMELAEIGQPWHLSVVENFAARLLKRVRRLQVRNRR